MNAANVDEDNINSVLGLAAEFSLSTKSSPASADFVEAQKYLTATVKYFIELCAPSQRSSSASPCIFSSTPQTQGPELIKTFLAVNALGRELLEFEPNRIGLTKDAKSLVCPIDPLVAQQLLRQGHVGATNPSGVGPAAMGLAGWVGGEGGYGLPCFPYGSCWPVLAESPVASPSERRVAPSHKSL